jgi:predicted nucleotidyltransferase
VRERKEHRLPTRTTRTCYSQRKELLELKRMNETKKTIPQEKLDRIIRRIVEVAKPEKIILFGSAARGEMGPHSDVDLLVIKAGANRLDLTGQIYRNLHGVGESVDVVVVTPEDVERYHDSHSLVIAPALKEGKVVYAA